MKPTPLKCGAGSFAAAVIAQAICTGPIAIWFFVASAALGIFAFLGLLAKLLEQIDPT